jgi:hypothetical protein
MAVHEEDGERAAAEMFGLHLGPEGADPLGGLGRLETEDRGDPVQRHAELS